MILLLYLNMSNEGHPFEEILKILKPHLTRFNEAYCVSEAILEDYAKVISKMEGVEEKKIKDRVLDRAQQILEKLKE